MLPGVPEKCCRGGKEGGGTCAGRRCRPGGGEALARAVRLEKEKLSVPTLKGSSENDALLYHKGCSGKVGKPLIVRGSNSRNLFGCFKG